MLANETLRSTRPPTTCLLDKSIPRAVFEARVRVLRGVAPLPHQADAALVYQALLRLGFTVYVTPEMANVAQRRGPILAASVLTPLGVLAKGRYLRRWARRLRGFGFGREDTVVLAYGSFGVDMRRRTLGAELIVSADRSMLRCWDAQRTGITRRFQAMTCQLSLPYRLAHLPTPADPQQLLVELL